MPQPAPAPEPPSPEPPNRPVPDDRERRISELRRRVDDGSYQIDAAEIAASMVDKHLRR